MRAILLSTAAAALLLPLNPANAQDDPAAAAPAPDEEQAEAAEPAQPDEPPATARAAHHDHAGDIVVTGVRRAAGDALGGVSVLDDAELARELRPSIGETLAKQPGVTASSFGPAASRPILRGLSGDRVRILADGIGSLDVSSSSPDHAVAINPLTAERIEILRGPAALLYGSSAIGGVVNVIDTRIPRHEPEGPVGVDALVSYGSAADESAANASLDVPLGGHFIAHVDGNWTRTGNLETGGHLLSKALRKQALASPDPEIRALAGLEGELPNSASRAWEIAGGAAYVDGRLNIGLSVSRHDARYGVPIRFSLDPDVEAEAPTIDVKQTRYDARAEVPLSGFFSEVRARGGISRYRHNEIEDTGDIASTFFARGGEGRVELEQAARGGWEGTSGVQYLQRKVHILGEEKFLPPSRQSQSGLFTMQSYVAGPLRLEAGARIEFSRLAADEDQDLGTPALRRKFTTVSASAGGAYELAPGWRAGLTLSRSARAPSVEELFANGPHAGTQAFEVGNLDLDPERSLSIEASLRRTAGPLRLSGSLYYSRFSNFIFQAPSGAIEDALPVYAYRQGRAKYYGFELQADARFGTALGIEWGTELVADGVRATIEDFGPAPQIPPLRLLGALTGARGPFDGRLEVEHAFRQSRNAPLETETPAYTLLNASIDWHPLVDRPELTVTLAADNIFDVVARRHSSLLKDFAPLAGRDIRLTASFGF